MRNYVENFNSDRQTFQTEVKEYLANTSIDLEERWNTFLECNKLLDVHIYVSDVMDIFSDCLYDDFYIEKNETKYYSDLDAQICENITPQGETPDEYSSKYDAFYAKRDRWREAVLEDGYAGFTYDW